MLDKHAVALEKQKENTTKLSKLCLGTLNELEKFEKKAEQASSSQFQSIICLSWPDHLPETNLHQAGEEGDEHGAQDGGQVEEVDGGEQEADPPGDQPRPTSRSPREQVDCWTDTGRRAAPAPEAFLKYCR